MNEISLDLLDNYINLNIIDIRENYRYNLGHIPFSKNIFYKNLSINPDYYLDKNKIYYLYCEYGLQSKYLTTKLNSLGFKTYSIKGGYQEYILKK